MSDQTKKRFGVDENKPTEWFETLYSETDQKGEGIPWANMAPHPIFKQWIDKKTHLGDGKTALVIGCGLGDDAIELESQGFNVTAFDVSSSAIELCKKRFPNSNVTFLQADLLKGIPEWHRKFDFVLEIFTIQALPPKYENILIQNISDFVSEKGMLMIITEINKEERTFEKGPPWLLNSQYIKSFEKCGLKSIYHSSDQKPEFGEELHLTLFQRD
ncbi:hypothetical protein UJ101_00677 [Flavobacteriaceae bacterium UJ101]|nr:hypothetical protein UJ101_00677 [Flavobacteriaceae bacterium UJ101]